MCRETESCWKNVKKRNRYKKTKYEETFALPLIRKRQANIHTSARNAERQKMETIRDGAELLLKIQNKDERPYVPCHTQVRRKPSSKVAGARLLTIT